MAEFLGALGVGVGQFSAGTILVILVLMVMWGKVPTLRELRDVQADRDMWKATADDLLKTVTQYGMSLEKLLDYARTQQTVLETLQDLAEAAASREEGQGRP